MQMTQSEEVTCDAGRAGIRRQGWKGCAQQQRAGRFGSPRVRIVRCGLRGGERGTAPGRRWRGRGWHLDGAHLAVGVALRAQLDLGLVQRLACARPRPRQPGARSGEVGGRFTWRGDQVAEEDDEDHHERQVVAPVEGEGPRRGAGRRRRIGRGERGRGGHGSALLLRPHPGPATPALLLPADLISSSQAFSTSRVAICDQFSSLHPKSNKKVGKQSAPPSPVPLGTTEQTGRWALPSEQPVA